MNAATVAELDREFNAPGSTMHLSTYNSLRNVLLSEAAPAMNDEEKQAVAVVEGIAQLNESLRDMGTQASIEWLALESSKHRAQHDLQNRRWNAFRAGLGPTLRAMVQASSSLSGRIAKLERAPGSQGAGVSIVADNVAVPGVERLAEMMQQLDSTLRSPVRPIYGKDGVLIGAQREPLPDDEPAARSRKPRLKLRDGAFVMIDGYHR